MAGDLAHTLGDDISLDLAMNAMDEHAIRRALADFDGRLAEPAPGPHPPSTTDRAAHGRSQRTSGVPPHAGPGRHALFLRAERRPDGQQTFRVVVGEPLPTSHGADVYRRVFGRSADRGPAP